MTDTAKAQRRCSGHRSWGPAPARRPNRTWANLALVGLLLATGLYGAVAPARAAAPAPPGGWSSLEPMPGAPAAGIEAGAAAAVLDCLPGAASPHCGAVLVTRRTSSGPNQQREAHLYLPATGQWVRTGPMGPAAGWHHVTALALTKESRPVVLVLNRLTGAGVLFEPGATTANTALLGGWQEIAPLPAPPRRGATASVLSDGTILLAGGCVNACRTPADYDVGAGTWIFSPNGNTTVGEEQMPGGWKPAPSLTVGRGGHSAALLPDGRVLVTGGSRVESAQHVTVPVAELYDPNEPLWIPTGSQRKPRVAADLTTLSNGDVLLSGGVSCPGALAGSFGRGGLCAPDVSAEVYEPEQGVWRSTGPMSTPRALPSTTMLTDGRVFVAGGGDALVSAPVPLESVEVYHPAEQGTDEAGAPVPGAWLPGPAMVEGRVGHAAVRLADGAVLVAGATTAGVEVFEPRLTAQRPSVVSKTPSAGPTAGGTEVTLTGAGFRSVTAVQFGTGDQLHDALYYRVETSRRIVAVTPPHQPGVVDIVVSVAGDEGVIVSSRRLSIARFTYEEEASGIWLSAGSLAEERAFHTATRLETGAVLVAGGLDSSGRALATAELYDPATERWTPLGVPGKLATPRASHTAILLTGGGCDAGQDRPQWCGKVLVTGGYTIDPPAAAGARQSRVLTSAELYDPETRTWSDAGDMATPRTHHSATALRDGTILVVSGCSQHRPPGCRRPPGTTQVFDPSAEGSWWQPEMDVATTEGGVIRKWSVGTHTATGLPGGEVVVGSWLLYRDGAWHELSREGEGGRPDANALGSHAAAVLIGGDDARVVVAGGWRTYNESGPPPSLVETDVYEAPTTGHRNGRRLPAEPLQTARSHAAAAPWGHGAVVAGGCEDWDYLDQCVSVTPTVEQYDLDTGTWVSVSPLASARFGHSATLLAGDEVDGADDRVLVVGGRDTEDVLASAEILGRPTTLMLGALEPSSGPTTGGTGVVLRGAGFLHDSGLAVTFGGVAAIRFTVRSDTEIVAVAPPLPPGPVDVVVIREGVSSRPVRFTYAAGAWATTDGLTECHESPASCTPRYRHTATVLHDGRVLVAGGYSSGACVSVGRCPAAAPTSSAQLYDPRTQTWAPTGAMAAPRAGHTATLLRDGTVLVVGGDGMKAAELYEPELSGFRPAGLLFDARTDHTATLLPDGDVLVAGGFFSDEPVKQHVPSQEEGRAPPNVTVHRTVERYDFGTSRWEAAGQLATERTGHSSVLLPDGSLLVAGGCRDFRPHWNLCISFPRSAERSSGQGQWSAADAGALGVGRIWATATLLGDGTVLVAGGCGHGELGYTFSRCDAHSRLAELYDYRAGPSGGWEVTTPLPSGQAGHSATLLGDGRVLVVGSGTYRQVPARTASVYDPESRRWTPTSLPAHGRDGHTATTLEDGGVLLVGGAVAGGFRFEPGGRRLPPPAVDSAEVYTPAPAVTAISPAYGPTSGGTTVRITGRDLSRATTVSFGGAPADFTVKSPELIEATSPARAPGAVDVVVTTPGGVSLSASPAAYRFTYLGTGVPGAVGDLVARAQSDTEILLSFTTAGTDGAFGPPATRYLVKESSTPITNEVDFEAAPALCDGVCSFPAASLGHPISLTVRGRTPGTTYHYALRALGQADVPGPISNPAWATTTGTPPAPFAQGISGLCPHLPVPGPAQVAYPPGYSMVGLPEGTKVGAQSPLYGWFDLGARGSYSARDGSEPVAGGHAYWAWFSCPRLVEMSGPGAPAASLPLGGYRASMVGNPSGTGPVRVSGHDFAARWDPTLNGGSGGYHVSGYRETKTLPVGEGIWVFSYRDTMVNLRG